MGLFDWIFRKQVKNREELVDPGVTLTFRVERVKTQEACCKRNGDTSHF
jgi:hypothetical protein